MNKRLAISSVFQSIFVLALFLEGLFFLLLPHRPLLCQKIIKLLTFSPYRFTEIGLGISLSALFFFFLFYWINQGRYLVIKMGVETSPKLVQKAVADFLEKQFPKKIALKDFFIGSRSDLFFEVRFLVKDQKEKEALYLKVEESLTILLRGRFGYTKPFLLISKE